MCARCHYRHHKQGPEEYTAWFLQTYGEDAYLDLVRRSKQPVKRLTFVKEKAEEIL